MSECSNMEEHGTWINKYLPRNAGSSKKKNCNYVKLLMNAYWRLMNVKIQRCTRRSNEIGNGNQNAFYIERIKKFTEQRKKTTCF